MPQTTDLPCKALNHTQSMFGGIYLPIPPPLERFLVPSGDCEIRLELMSGNLIDMRTTKHWIPKEATTQQ